MPDSNNFITISYSDDVLASAGLSASELAAGLALGYQAVDAPWLQVADLADEDA